MSSLSTWILTFNRPLALNRQIDAFKSWTTVNVFSNHPHVQLSEDNIALYKEQKLGVVYNTLSDPEATSYCARSWNNIFIKAFKTEEEIICVQDDTLINAPAAFRDLILDNKDKYDLIWGPAGDQFFYVKKKVLERVGWFDERYLGAYCGDADWLKRVWQQWDHSRLSIAEAHDWGFIHNSIGVERYIPTGIQSKACDATYINQDQEIQQKMGRTNPVLEQSQSHYCAKWGHMLNGTGPVSKIDVPFGSLIQEIDWYPWFSKKYLNRYEA